MRNERGQVLAFFALVLPIVLLPVGAYAVDATIVASRAAGLQAATAEAAEAAAQQVDTAALRSRRVLVVDPARARAMATQTMSAEEPAAIIESSTVNGVDVTVVASERITLPFSIFTSTIAQRAHATARLTIGYEIPIPSAPRGEG
jgi:hypothetical protein